MNLLGVAVLVAQLSIPHLPSVPQIPSIPGVPNVPQLPSSIPLPPLIKAPPNSIEMTPANELHQIPELDAFVPARFAALVDVPRTADGLFQLVPGAFELIDQSFCLRAGAHGPTTASAYLAGSLGGSRVTYVRSVIAGWRNHPEFTQGDIQSLLWGITSQTKISQMTPHLQIVAAALLTPQQLSALNGDALGSAVDFLQKYGGNLPAPVRDVLSTESQVRDMLTHGNYSYEQLVALAVVVHPSDPDKTRNRWSYDPRGFFIRYLPTNFITTTIQLYVPPAYGFLHDASGRVTRIVDDRGSELDVTYPTPTSVNLTYLALLTTPTSGTVRARVPLGAAMLKPAVVTSPNQQLRAIDALARTAEPLLTTRLPARLARIEPLNFLRGAVPAMLCVNLGGCTAGRVASTSIVGLGVMQTLLDVYNSVAAKLGFQPLGQSGKPAPPDKSKDCARVKDEVQFDKDYQKLYSDPAIVAAAQKGDWNGSQFQNAVHAAGEQEFGGSSGGSNGGGTGGESGTNSGFSQGGETNFDTCTSTYPTREQVAAHGWPAIFYDMIKNHEDAHAAKCNDARNNTGENDTWQWRQALEIDGYNKSIKTLDKWIEANC